MAQPRGASVTITSGQTASAAYPLGELTLVGLRLPSTFDGTTVTFTCSDTAGGTFDTLLSDDGSTYTITCAASRYVAVDYTKFVGCFYIKVVAGTSQATTDSILTLYVASLT